MNYGSAECLVCGKVFVKKAPLHKVCTDPACRKKYRRETEFEYRHRRHPEQGFRHNRYSGNVYENTPEKLAAIFAKYENGVTREHIEEWINGL